MTAINDLISPIFDVVLQKYRTAVNNHDDKNKKRMPAEIQLKENMKIHVYHTSLLTENGHKTCDIDIKREGKSILFYFSVKDFSGTNGRKSKIRVDYVKISREIYDCDIDLVTKESIYNRIRMAALPLDEYDHLPDCADNMIYEEVSSAEDECIEKINIYDFSQGGFAEHYRLKIDLVKKEKSISLYFTSKSYNDYEGWEKIVLEDTVKIVHRPFEGRLTKEKLYSEICESALIIDIHYNLPHSTDDLKYTEEKQ